MDNYLNIADSLQALSLEPHVDRVRAYSKSRSLDIVRLVPYLKKRGFSGGRESEIEGTNFKNVRVFTRSGAKHRIYYNRRKKIPFLQRFLFQIDDPTGKDLRTIQGIAEKYKAKFTLSNVELALDFYPFRPSIFRFILNHLYMPYQQKAKLKIVGKTKKSIYHGDKKKHSWSSIEYEKGINDRNILRLELRLNRSAIKKANLGFDPNSFNHIDLSHRIKLLELDNERLARFLFKKLYEGEKSLHRDLIVRRKVARVAVFKKPFLEQKNYLKNHYKGHNTSRFFKERQPEAAIFRDLVSNLVFFPDENIVT